MQEIEDGIQDPKKNKNDFSYTNEEAIISSQKIPNGKNEQKVAFSITENNTNQKPNANMKIEEQLSTEFQKSTGSNGYSTANSTITFNNTGFSTENALNSDVGSDIHLNSNKSITIDASSNASVSFSTDYKNSNPAIGFKAGLSAKVSFEDIIYKSNFSNVKLKAGLEQQVGFSGNYKPQQDQITINPKFTTNLSTSLIYSPTQKWNIEAAAKGGYNITSAGNTYSLDAEIKSTYKESQSLESKSISFGATYHQEGSVNQTQNDPKHQVKFNTTLNLKKNLGLYSTFETDLPTSNDKKSDNNNKYTFGVKFRF